MDCWASPVARNLNVSANLSSAEIASRNRVFCFSILGTDDQIVQDSYENSGKNTHGH